MSASASPAAPLPTVMVLPTGIGCAIGGYAGDALPAARLLAAASGCLITHPNVMNGADRKSTRLNSSHVSESRMPSSA